MIIRTIRLAGGSVGLKIGSAAMTFLTTIFVARALSASGVGLFALAGAAATIGAIVASAGFDALALKLGARDCGRRTERRVWRIISVYILTLPVSSIAAMLVVAAVLALVGLGGAAMLAPVMVQTIALGVYRVVGASVQARGGILLSQIGELVVRPATVLVLTSFTAATRELTAQRLLWIMAAGCVVCLVYAIAILTVMAADERHRAHLRLPRRNLIASLVGRAPPYAGFFAIVLLIEQIDILLLGALRGEAEAGLYQPASRIAWFASLGATAISIIARPQMARAAASRDPVRLQHLMDSYRLASIGYFAIASLCLISFSDQIFLLFGRDYQGASSIVFILLLLHGVSGAIGPVDAAAQVLGSGGGILGRSILSLALFLVVGLALIPPLGAHGAAIGAVIGGVAYRLSFLIYVRRRVNALATTFQPA